MPKQRTEQFRFADYAGYDQNYSRIDDRGMTWELAGVYCPGCRTWLDPLEDRVETHCWKCGLILERRGDTLVCTTPWEEEEEEEDY